MESSSCKEGASTESAVVQGARDRSQAEMRMTKTARARITNNTVGPKLQVLFVSFRENNRGGKVRLKMTAVTPESRVCLCSLESTDNGFDRDCNVVFRRDEMRWKVPVSVEAQAQDAVLGIRACCFFQPGAPYKLLHIHFRVPA